MSRDQAVDVSCTLCAQWKRLLAYWLISGWQDECNGKEIWVKGFAWLHKFGGSIKLHEIHRML